LIAIFEFYVLRQIVGALRQLFVEMEDFGAVVGLRLVLWRSTEDAEPAGTPFLRYLSRVDVPLKAAVDRVARPMRRTQRAVGRIDTGNARDQDIGVRQVQP